MADLKPVYKKTNGEWVKQNAYQMQNGEWVQISKKATEGLAYTLSDDGTYYICTGIGTATDTDIVIANEIDGLAVIEIANRAFLSSKHLTSVIIPDSVTSIGERAFYNCSSLASVTIGNSVTSIGERAFYNCYKLSEVINHSSLTIVAGKRGYGDVGYYAIEVHTGESKVVIVNDFLFYPYDGVNYLVAYVGEEKDLVLPESYNGKSYEINDYAFYECTSLTSITIGNSITSIGSYAFYECTSLEKVHITDMASWYNISFGNGPSNPICYAKRLYLNNELVTDLVIPDDVTRIGKYAFLYCTSLTSITIPESVTSIGRSAFLYCTSLTSITIPDSVTIIGDYALYDCTKLANVYYTGTAEQWAAISIGSYNSSLTEATRHYNYGADEGGETV